MKNVSLSIRKVDSLDNWKELCTQRRLAYENNNHAIVQELNGQLIQKRKEGGWTDLEIEEEFEMYAQVLQHPFTPPVGNGNIKYDIRDDNGKPRGLSLSLHQVGSYWKFRDTGILHGEALGKVL